MTVQQKAFKSRRRYNQWVTNQTLEDFALRYTPVSARRWSASASTPAVPTGRSLP